MEIVYGLNEVVNVGMWPVVTLGVFDGVHKGHSAVIEKTINWAKEMNGKSIVITFNNSPKVVLGKRPSSIITSIEHRLNIFRKMGVDTTIILQFNDDIANIKAEDFIKNIINDWLKVRGVVLGCDCSFGKDCKGNQNTFLEYAKSYGFEVRCCESVNFNGKRISSTLIRETILNGDLDRAESMQGRPVSGYGTVVSGSGRGSKVLFPTANVDLHHEVLPPHGVYGTVVWLKGVKYHAITNVGIRPTFESETGEKSSSLETVVEVHILDFDESIYGMDLEVQFLLKIRDEKKFDGVEELKKQILYDKEYFLNYIKNI